MSNKVVARFVDGRILKGSSFDVDPNRPKCHLREADGTMTQVQLADLKALFFVKDMAGNPAHVEGRDIAAVDPRLRGTRLVEVTFQDGERIVGLTTRFPPNKPYFFLVPVDSSSNNLRVLVNGEQLRDVTLLEGPPDA